MTWREQVACARPGVDPEWFFPVKGGSPWPALRICQACPVQEQCLDEALAESSRRDRYGVRGGKTVRQRERLRAQRRRAAA